jgi:hypothetical protein
VAACPGILASDATAEEIYRWVDADGGVHYSDTRPEHDAPVAVLEIEASPASEYNAADDPYSILNQAARVHQNWLDLEAVRQERVQQRNEGMANREPLPPQEYDSYLDYSTYPYYAYWPAGSSDYQPGEARDQAYALRTLDLIGPRPASINSGEHQDRVFRSQFLPLVPPAPAPPRPTPY